MEYDSFERNGVSVPTAEITVREMVLLGSPRRSNSADQEVDDDLDEEAVVDEELAEVG
jgi:hypothetical protein